MKRKTCTVEEAAALLGIGRSSAYAAINSGEIPSIRIGRRVLVPVAALDLFLEQPALHRPGFETERGEREKLAGD
jgi:excisionase family DNA binding protein